MQSRARVIKVEAVIIAHRDFGEADRLLRLFSLEHGKLTAIAKGSRKIRSRKAAHIEPFTYASLVLARGKSFWIVTQADTKAGYAGIRADLMRTAKAAYILELADQLSADDQPDASVFHLITDTLQRLDSAEDAFNAVLNFEVRMLDYSGFRPDFFHCVRCHKDVLPEDQFFSAQQGGAVCPACAGQGGGLVPVAQDTLRHLRHFQRSAFKQLDGLKVDEKTGKAIYQIMAPYISYVTERKLNSPEFLNQITQRGQNGG